MQLHQIICQARWTSSLQDLKEKLSRHRIKSFLEVDEDKVKWGVRSLAQADDGVEDEEVVFAAVSRSIHLVRQGRQFRDQMTWFQQGAIHDVADCRS